MSMAAAMETPRHAPPAVSLGQWASASTRRDPMTIQDTAAAAHQVAAEASRGASEYVARPSSPQLLEFLSQELTGHSCHCITCVRTLCPPDAPPTQPDIADPICYFSCHWYLLLLLLLLDTATAIATVQHIIPRLNTQTPAHPKRQYSHGGMHNLIVSREYLRGQQCFL